LLDLGYAVWAQQAVFGQNSFENASNQTENRLDTIIELLEQSRQGSIIQLNLTIIVFMMGLAFVIFGLYIGQEQKLSVFTKRLYLIAYFALIVPITVILYCIIVKLYCIIVNAGINTQKEHHWGEEFINRKFAVMIEGSWMPRQFIPMQDFENQIGFLPMFPVPNEDNQTSTLMGGWEFSIPITSTHKNLAWKLVTLMIEPKILGPWLVEHRLLPTQSNDLGSSS
jgi:hypothetical protein